MVSVLRVYCNNTGEEYTGFVADSEEIFKVVNYYNDRFEVISCMDDNIIGWVENIYGIDNLSELKDKKIKFCKGSIYVLNDNNEVEKEFIGNQLRPLK